ncbi:hypothetical protein BGX28_010212 [Mortierella sp. GBA30]|nr:hypothetical protein BGX28_010212 [Mortierella sp. GBA30]
MSRPSSPSSTSRNTPRSKIAPPSSDPNATFWIGDDTDEENEPSYSEAPKTTQETIALQAASLQQQLNDIAELALGALQEASRDGTSPERRTLLHEYVGRLENRERELRSFFCQVLPQEMDPHIAALVATVRDHLKPAKR